MRQTSNVEELMVAVLKKRKRPMSLLDVAEEILKLDPLALSGKTPRNSLYSILYRREKRRIEMGEKTMFRTVVDHQRVLYMLNK